MQRKQGHFLLRQPPINLFLKTKYITPCEIFKWATSSEVLKMFFNPGQPIAIAAGQYRKSRFTCGSKYENSPYIRTIRQFLRE
ncbi:hypothetical protein CKO41_12615 [Thiococcus pfennigii]|nr:hypothetical protein [Thiococcus pfennigii]